MPADQLTHDDVSAMEAAVLAVLTGRALAHVAQERGIKRAALTEAISTYQHAGRSALAHQANSGWQHRYLHFTDWEHADATFARELMPVLENATTGTPRWWYTRKHPCWRFAWTPATTPTSRPWTPRSTA